MPRIWIDANNSPYEPAFTSPKFGIQKNLHTVADLQLLRHVTLFAAACPKEETDPCHNENTAVDRPLRLASHGTAGQNVNSLEEENTTRKDEYYTEDIERNFHENIFISLKLLR